MVAYTIGPQMARRARWFTLLFFAFAIPSLSAPIDAQCVLKRDIAQIMGEQLTVKWFTLTSKYDLSLIVLPSGDRTRNPHLVRVSNATGKILTRIPLDSPYVRGMSSTIVDDIVVFDKLNKDNKDTRGVFRTITSSGSVMVGAEIDGGIAAFSSSGDSLVYLTPDGRLKKTEGPKTVSELLLIADRTEFPHQTILASAVSLVKLRNGVIGVVSKASGKLYTADFTTGKVSSFVLEGPELDKARETYSRLAVSSARALPAGKQLATPTPALATTTSKDGTIFTLVSPYSQSSGATIIKSDSTGRYLGSIHVPLDVFQGSYFGPSFMQIEGSTIFLLAPDGKLAEFALKEKL